MAREERIVLIRPRTVLTVVGILLAVSLVLWVIYLTRGVFAWILIALFLAMALNPVVDFLMRRGLRRGPAALITFCAAIIAIGGIGYLLIPPLVRQVTDFIEAVPDLIRDLTEGQGPLGFLERDYQIVERVRDAIDTQGAGGVFGFTNAGLSLARSLLTTIVGTVSIAFLTLFLLLDGQRLLGSIQEWIPDSAGPRWQRTFDGIYRTVGGYVTGNILISIIAGAVATAVLFATGTPYAVSLGVVIALFDLIPLAGATIGAVIVLLVALATKGWVIALVVGLFFLVYQQVENHVLQPLIYGRTVRLSPLIVLCSVLIGAELAGVLGALVAIPVAGTLQVVAGELLTIRRERAGPPSPHSAPPG